MIAVRLSNTRRAQSQRERAHEIVAKMVQGAIVQYTDRGRPFISERDIDISISHRMQRVLVGMVSGSKKIGVDVEYLESDISERRFHDNILSNEEKKLIHVVCAELRMSLKHALILFWCLKEAACKCLDVDLVPTKAIIEALHEGKAVISLESNRLHGRVFLEEQYCYCYVISEEGFCSA